MTSRNKNEMLPHLQNYLNLAIFHQPSLHLNAIQDENARQLIRRLLNLIEKLSADLCEAQARQPW